MARLVPLLQLLLPPAVGYSGFLSHVAADKKVVHLEVGTTVPSTELTVVSGKAIATGFRQG